MRLAIPPTGDPEIDALRRCAGELLEAGLAAVDARSAVIRALAAEPVELREAGLDLLAVGKAAAGMLEGALASLPRPPTRILLITPGTGDPPSSPEEGITALSPDSPGMARTGGRFRALRAAHPVPEASSVEAAEAALELAGTVPPDRDLLVLLSGGASALMCAPVSGVGLELKQRVTRHLLRSGADIVELNTVRKHLSRVKGGQLLRAFTGRRVRVLMISDVAGDDPALIGSGPFAPDPSTFADAIAVMRRRCREHSGDLAPVMAHLALGAAGRIVGPVAPGDPIVARVSHQVVGSVRIALDAIATAARARGLRVLDLGDRLAGEAREAPARLRESIDGGGGEPSGGADAAGVDRPGTAREPGAPAAARPGLLALWGGETTVTVRGDGLGGRNQELALAAIEGLRLDPPWALAALGTDGIDGPTPAAGAVVDSGSSARARARDLDPAAFLARSDSHHFFAGLGDLLTPGPTGTNVGDLVVLLRGPAGP